MILEIVFPAEAGVNLLGNFYFFSSLGIPRGGGGEPEALTYLGIVNVYSPRRRG